VGIISGGGGGGGNTTAQVVASGKVLPVAAPTGVTVNTTTYNDTVKGSGKLTTLVFPSEQGAFALALAGDAFPRMVIGTDPTDVGILGFGDGTADVFSSAFLGINGSGGFTFSSPGGSANQFGQPLNVSAATGPFGAPRLAQLSPSLTITSGALPTVQLVTATAAQIITTRDAETHTPVTFNPGVATTATCTVAISPDNSTFSTLAVITKPVGTVFDGEIDDVTVRLPAGWFIKLTVVNATLGLTTYF